MHKEKRAFKKNATIKIEPYLAEYIIGKYGVDKKKWNGKNNHTLLTSTTVFGRTCQDSVPTNLIILTAIFAFPSHVGKVETVLPGKTLHIIITCLLLLQRK